MDQDSISESPSMVGTSEGVGKEVETKGTTPMAHLQLVSVPSLSEVKVNVSGESRGFLPSTSGSINEEDLTVSAATTDTAIDDAPKPVVKCLPELGRPNDNAGESMSTEDLASNSILTISEDVPKAKTVMQNGVCCNCAVSVFGDNVRARRLREFTKCSVFDMRKKSMEKKDVKILEVLTNLFVLRSKSKMVSRTLGSELLMCGNCVRTLSLLYQLYNEFLSLSVMAGAAISKVICTRPQKKGRHRKFVSRNSKNVPTSKGRLSKRVPPVTNTGKRTVEGNGISIIRTETLKLENRRISITRRNVNSMRNGKQNNERSELEAKGEFIAKPDSETVTKGETTAISAQSERKSKPMILRSEFKTESDQEESFHQLEESDSGNVCRRCGKSFKSDVGLKVHYASHLRDDNKFKCKDCGKKFRKQDALDTHWKIDHEGFKPHKCPHEGCDRSFRLKDKLKLHVQVTHEKRKPFPCPKCDKSFRTKYHLKVHDVSQHIHGDNSFGCSQCRRKFDSREALDMHVATHQGDKPFVCNVCQKGFQTSSRLKLHGKSHDVIPSCICSMCGKAYKHVRDLRLHEVIHQDESTFRFACGDCPKKFYRIDLLRVHQSNEQHFSPETVGPSMSKLDPTDSAKPKIKGRKRENISISGLNDEEQLFEELESQTEKEIIKDKNKRPTKSKKNANKKHRPSSNNNTLEPLYQPNLTTISEDMIHHRHHPPDNVHLGNSQTQKYSSLDKATEVYNSNLEDNKTTNFQETTSHINNLTFNTPLQPFQLPGHSARSAVFPLKDTSDRGLPSFCIAAGAEQIGFDVISAFINNLN